MRAAVAVILIRWILKVTVGHAMLAWDAGCQPFLPARQIRGCLHAGRKGARCGGARRCNQVFTRLLWLDYRGGATRECSSIEGLANQWRPKIVDQHGISECVPPRG